MSSEQKKLEVIQNLFFSVKSILQFVKEIQNESKESYKNVKESVQELWENNFNNEFKISVVFESIVSTPIVDRVDFEKATKVLIQQMRLKKEKLDYEITTRKVQEYWIIELTSCYWKVVTYNYTEIMKAISQIMRLLQNIRNQLFEEDDSDPDKKKKEKSNYNFENSKGLGEF